MKPRLILVIGAGRSGTSCVAGVLHTLGVRMGIEEHLIGPHPEFNPKGHFEDRCFHSFLAEVRANEHRGGATGAQWTELQRLLAEHQQGPVWGLKDASLVHPGEWVAAAAAPDYGLRVVAVHRRFDGIVASRQRHANEGQGATYSEAVASTLRHLEAMGGTLRRLGARYPVYHVQYEEMVKNPGEEVWALAHFVYAGLSWSCLDEGVVAQAVAFVDPELRHY